MYYVDYHIHSVFSNDGFIEIDEVCDKAVAEGFLEIAFADHYDPWAENPDCIDVYDPKAQLAAIDLKFSMRLNLGSRSFIPKMPQKSCKTIMTLFLAQYTV